MAYLVVWTWFRSQDVSADGPKSTIPAASIVNNRLRFRKRLFLLALRQLSEGVYWAVFRFGALFQWFLGPFIGLLGALSGIKCDKKAPAFPYPVLNHAEKD
tara:strand:- start:32670 stop:32972 length:303 start_codon:yes stop_codon:yes gene_type:complete